MDAAELAWWRDEATEAQLLAWKALAERAVAELEYPDYCATDDERAAGHRDLALVLTIIGGRMVAS